MTRLDRTGEPLDDLDEWPEIPAHDRRCDGHGWVDRDAEPAVPCLDCKPHLDPAELRRKTFGPDDHTARTENPDA